MSFVPYKPVAVWKKAMVFFKVFATGIDWHLKTTKIETSKYCIWTVRQNLEAKLTSWGSSFNLIWKTVFCFKFHRCYSTTWNCTPYYGHCCSKASKTQGTVDAVVKFRIAFLGLFSFKIKKSLWKKAFFHFRNYAMAVFKPFGYGIL